MLWKLSLSGLKNRIRDYLILFSGLVIASAIFYMFESMATNRSFLEGNSMISMTVYIFYLGSVLLSIITLIYILYANSFLLTMRQKDYGLLMMLGAKTRKIAQLIFLETFIIGFVSTIVGTVLGVGLSSIVNTLLTKQLHLKITHFSPINNIALITTILFFSILFFFASAINAASMVKKPILSLMKANQTPHKLTRSKTRLFIEASIGLTFLMISYYLMSNLVTTIPSNLKVISLIAMLIGVVIGTYLLFHSILVFVLFLLKSSERLSLKGINNFTLSQLSFRIQDFTKILTMVTILISLSLGAITVGLGFRNEVKARTNQMVNYDLVFNDAQKLTIENKKKILSLSPTYTATYHQKESEDTIYYNRDEVDSMPIHSIPDSNGKIEKYRTSDFLNDLSKLKHLKKIERPDQSRKKHIFLSADDFNEQSSTTTTLYVVNLKDFYNVQQFPIIEELNKVNEKINPSILENDQLGIGSLNQRYTYYQMINSMFSGLEFMGFFLGIAFLTMLASCLMFKILSGAQSDIIRYQMLRRIGARRNLLQKSIRREIGMLFLIPAVLGAVHVLFGMKLFQSLIQKPYANIWLPFSLFGALYICYYVITFWIYSKLVNTEDSKTLV